MKLRIGFSMSKLKFKPLALSIVWWDKFKYKSTLGASHCYGRFTGTDWGVDFIYQSTGHGTNFMGQDRFNALNETKEEYELELPSETILLIGRECVKREGKKYGVKQLIGLMMINILTIVSFGKLNLKNPFSDGDTSTVCLEEVGRLLAKTLNLEIPLDLDSISVTPFRNFIASLPNVKKVT